MSLSLSLSLSLSVPLSMTLLFSVFCVYATDGLDTPGCKVLPMHESGSESGRFNKLRQGRREKLSLLCAK